MQFRQGKTAVAGSHVGDRLPDGGGGLSAVTSPTRLASLRASAICATATPAVADSSCPTER